MKSAYRAGRQVVAVLTKIPQGTGQREDGSAIAMQKTKTTGQRGKATGRRPEAGNAATHYNQEPKRAAGAGAGKPQALHPSVGATAIPDSKRQGGDVIATQQTKKEHQPLALSPQPSTLSHQPSALSHQPSNGMLPARPKHIDQYVHLLPKATQERASQYGELMRQLGEARDNMQLLMDDDHASAKSREQWAKQATKLDKKIRAIRDELDREWEKVAESGRVRVDALGNAFLTSDGESLGTSADGEGGEQKPVELTSEQKKRRRDLRKWLIDLRRGKEGKDREKRIEQWRVNWQEYLTLEPKEKALEDEKILEAAKHFGIDIGGNTAEHETVTD